MKLKLEYWIMLSLGILSISIILWFLFSDSSPLSAPSEFPPEMIILSSDVPIEIKRSGDAYWASVLVGDTINIGDILRSTYSGSVHFSLTNVGLLVTNGPFEFAYNRDKKRQPATLLVLNGVLHYTILKENLRVPINIASPDGVFEFSSSLTSSQINELVFVNNSGDLSIKVYSGTGIWSETTQNAIVRTGEILYRGRLTNELRKDLIPPATTVLGPGKDLSYYPGQMMSGFNFDWSEVESASEYLVRVIQLTGQDIGSVHLFKSSQNSHRILNLNTGIYKTQVTSLKGETIIASWSPPTYFSVNSRFKENMCRDIPLNDFFAEFAEVENGYLIYGCFNGYKPEENRIIAYAASDRWSIQPFTSNYLAPIFSDGYFETFVKRTNRAILLVTDINSSGFEFDYNLSQEPDEINKDRVKAAYTLIF